MLKIAFAGIGDHSRRAHIVHLAKNPDVELIAGFDPGAGAFETVEKKTGIILKPYPSFEDMVANSGADAVLISSPDAFHLPQLKTAVEHGLHVFCEKPLCATQKEVEVLKQILNNAAQKGLIATSCHPRRTDPPYVWLKQNLPDLIRQFGAVMHIGLDFSYHQPSSDKKGLHGDSMLQDHANHEIDYVNYLLGHSPFEAVKLSDTFDQYSLAGRRDDDVDFFFTGSRRLAGSVYPESIRIRFERAELFIDTYNQDNSRILHHEDNTSIAISPGTTDYDIRFSKINRNWVDAMMGRTQNYLSHQDLVLNSAMSVGFHGNRQWSTQQL